MSKPYWSDYEKRPMGGNNPYWCCVGCGLTDPQINGDIDKHLPGCSEVAKLDENELRRLKGKI